MEGGPIKKAIGWFVVIASLFVSFSFVGGQCEGQRNDLPLQLKKGPLLRLRTGRKLSRCSSSSVECNVVHYDARLTADETGPQGAGDRLLGPARRGRPSEETQLDREEKGLRFYHQAGPVGQRL